MIRADAKCRNRSTTHAELLYKAGMIHYPIIAPAPGYAPDAVFFAQARSCQGDAVVSDVEKGLAQVILARHGRMLSMRRLQRVGGGALCVQTCQKDQVL